MAKEAGQNPIRRGRGGSKPGERRGGRKPGVPNKATTTFRQTVTSLLEKNSANVEKWLDQVANGVPHLDPESGKPIPGKWLVEPDPAKALDQLGKLAEFAAPKLNRTEVVGDPDAPIVMRETSDAELERIIQSLELRGRR